MVKFNLITGFLGSGKTTLLSHLLKELSKTKRIAIIQNEIAPSGVDGKNLKQTGEDFELLEINNGSVFCVCQLNNFEQSLQKLIEEFMPEVVFLEASGLADPISIAELLQISSLENKITLDNSICLVDAENYYRGLKSLTRFKHQIMIADKIILNKTDLYAGDINTICEDIKKLNPFAEIIPSAYARVSWSQLGNNLINKGEAAQKYQGFASEGKPDEVKAFVLRLHDRINIQNLEKFILSLQDRCMRIKGFVNLSDGTAVLMQSVFNHLEIKPVLDYSGPTEIIVFGREIKLGELRKKFKTYASKSRE